MPMNEAQLDKKVLKSLRAFIKSISVEATPQEFQSYLSKAVAYGIIKSVKRAKGVGTTGSSATGPSIGIKGLKPLNMVSAAKKVFLSKNGTVGVALIPILTAIFSEVATHMKIVKIESISGYGGSINKITNISKEIVLKNILKELPPQIKAPIMKSAAGKILFEAVASGFATDLLKSGKPSPIPTSGGDSTGPTIARFS